MVGKYVCLDTHTSKAAEPDVVTNTKTKTAEDWRWSGSMLPILRVVHVVKMRLSAIWKCMHQYFYLSSFKAVSPTLNGEEQPGGTQKPKSKHCHQTSEK